MNNNISKLKILFFVAMTVMCGATGVMAQDIPDEYIYFDLAAGHVVFSGGNYTGYVYVNGTLTKVSASHKSSNKYYIYQSSTKSGNNDKSHTGYASTADFDARQNCRVPNYPAVTYGGQNWSEYITNNSDVDAVQTNWNTAISGTDRTSTPKRICFRNNSTYNVVLDNIYTTYEIGDQHQREKGGITIGHTESSPNTYLSNCKVTLKLKGDNRISSIFYYSGKETDNSELHLTSADGDASNSGSMTVVSYVRNFSQNNGCCIGSAGDDGVMRCSYRTYFDGGTVFAGMPKYKGTGVWDDSGNVTHVIGSRRETGVIITGGQLTAVSNSTAAAIGGGGGYTSAGGSASVDITGGYVYAYNHSIYVNDKTQTPNIKTFVPCVAIGGSSSVEEPATLTTVNISGGHVYAQSMGGCAIGGGGSSQNAGGPANINISGDAYVEARSLAGSIGGHAFPAGASIGGGTGGTNKKTNGGYSIFHIDGGTLRAGSIGGGSTLSSTGKVGYVEAYITDGDVQAQFMMAEGSTGHCIFNMSGGALHGSDYTSTDFPLVKSDGGALWMDDTNGKAKITGGEIYANKANNGGAFYMTGGQLEITGGEIYGNTAATNGGSAYMGGGDFKMSAGKVRGNTASVNGGGFFVNGGSVTITGGSINNNTASNGNGGGFYSAGGAVDISKAVISSNNADNGSGGGLYSAASITVGTTESGSGATVSGNHAKNGAGFCVAEASGKTTTIQGGSTISDNIATEDGGGAYIASGNLSILFSDINDNEASRNGGGIYAGESSIVTMSDGDISDNQAKNGGGIYLASGADMSMSNGLIRYNTAVSSEGATIPTAYHAGSDPSIQGVGGAIYLSSGTEAKDTKLTFDLPKTVGIYGNTATLGADEIFADGLHTQITVPDVEGMDLREYHAKVDGWYEDYITGDTHYADGTNIAPAGTPVRRYEDYIANMENPYLVPNTTASEVDKYICLRLGYTQLRSSLIIIKSGMKKGESAIFKVSKTAAESQILYTVSVVAGDDGSGEVTINSLPMEEYTVQEEGWSWAYDSDQPEGKITQDIGENNTFTFVNTQKEIIPLHDEAYKNNKFGNN